MGDDILIVDENSLRDKIYIIRGMQVMLDFDLAKIYGYTTKAFNQQVKNNIEKFPADFRFRLTNDENDNLRSNNFTSSWGGTRYLPYAFTEQGVYMLMTVLKGELATMQSIALVRLFKKLKDHIFEKNILISEKKIIDITEKVVKNSDDIKDIKDKMVSKSDISVFMRLFDSGIRDEDFLILDGKPFNADIVYQSIYSKAKKSVIVIDDYIGVKTLRYFVHAPANVTFTVVSDNKGGCPLRLSELKDFQAEYPGRNITFLQSRGKLHDRYIILDSGRSMKVYHCGASSKDAGKRITTITRIKGVEEYRDLAKILLGNPALALK